jgi:hypothetical protein
MEPVAPQSNLLRIQNPGIGEMEATDANSNPAPEDDSVDIEGIVHAAQSFNTILYPVSLTMILACFCTIYVQQSQVAIEDSQKIYQQKEETGTNAQKGGQAVLQAVIVICLFAFLTFVIVFCVWMRCYKVRSDSIGDAFFSG